MADRGDPGTPGLVGLTSDPAMVTINVIKAVADGAVTVDAAGVVRIGATAGDDVILVTHTADVQPQLADLDEDGIVARNGDLQTSPDQLANVQA